MLLNEHIPVCVLLKQSFHSSGFMGSKSMYCGREDAIKGQKLIAKERKEDSIVHVSKAGEVTEERLNRMGFKVCPTNSSPSTV